MRKKIVALLFVMMVFSLFGCTSASSESTANSSSGHTKEAEDNQKEANYQEEVQTFAEIVWFSPDPVDERTENRSEDAELIMIFQELKDSLISAGEQGADDILVTEELECIEDGQIVCDGYQLNYLYGDFPVHRDKIKEAYYVELYDGTSHKAYYLRNGSEVWNRLSQLVSDLAVSE